MSPKTSNIETAPTAASGVDGGSGDDGGVVVADEGVSGNTSLNPIDVVVLSDDGDEVEKHSTKKRNTPTDNGHADQAGDVWADVKESPSSPDVVTSAPDTCAPATPSATTPECHLPPRRFSPTTGGWRFDAVPSPMEIDNSDDSSEDPFDTRCAGARSKSMPQTKVADGSATPTRVEVAPSTPTRVEDIPTSSEHPPILEDGQSFDFPFDACRTMFPSPVKCPSGRNSFSNESPQKTPVKQFVPYWCIHSIH